MPEASTSKVISPTVGRRVWYRPSAFDKSGPGGMTATSGQPLDAGVVAVWGDRCVNLDVTDILGKHFGKQSVTLIQEGDAKPVDAAGNDIGGYCEWMPHQQAQVRKQEVAEGTK